MFVFAFQYSLWYQAEFFVNTWRRHQMETFSALLAICAGNSPVLGEFPAQRPTTRSFDVLFDLRLNKRLSKQSWGWWFETLLRSLWRHRNDSMCLWLHQGLLLSSNQLCPSDKVFQDDFVWIKSCLSHFILKLCANVFGEGIYSVECCIKDSPKMLSRFWWIW